MKKQIAVIGACCSRDMFNSQFVYDWKDSFDLIYYAFQTSFISMMSEPIPYSRKLISFEGKNYSLWYKNIFERELTKSFCNDLVSLYPDNLFIDFYSDVVNGVWEIEQKTYLTHRVGDQNNNAAFSLVGNRRRITVLENHDEYMDIWKNSIDNFLEFMYENLPQANIIVNVPRFNDEIRHPDGTIEKYKDNNVEKYNEIYREMISYIAGKKQICFLDLEKKYYLNPNYIFGGAGIVHFHNEYYKDTISKLYNLCQEPNNILSKDSVRNLVINSKFTYGSLFYKYWDNIFSIHKKDEDNVVCVRQENNTKEIWAQIWCYDIPIDGSGRVTYTISFDYMVDSTVRLTDRTIAAIRIFDKPGCYTRAESVEQIVIKHNDGRNNEYIHYSMSIVPKGKYLSLGLYCSQNGWITWKDLRVVRNSKECKSEAKNTNVVDDLVKSELLDVNNLNLLG